MSTSGETTQPVAQSRQLLDAARQEALRIISEAQVQAQELLNQSIVEGEQKTLVLLSSAEEERKAMLVEAESEIFDLVLQIAREVIGTELQQNPLSISARIQSALQSLKQQNDLTVQFSTHLPVEILDKVKSQLLEFGIKNFETNAELSANDAKILTSRGALLISPLHYLGRIENSFPK